MGYSITAETGAKLDANRAAGRLCSGGARHCVAKATRKVFTDTWLSRIGEGASHNSALKMCGSHAKPYTVGFEGVNFRVTSVEKF